MTQQQPLRDSDLVYLHVKNELAKATGLEVKEMGSDGLYLPAPFDHLFDVHISTSRSFFWNFFQLKLGSVARRYPHWSILLIGGRVRTLVNDDDSEYQKTVLIRIYNISSAEYARRLSNQYWTEGANGGFKINDESDDLSGIPSFASIQDLVRSLG